MLAKVPQFSFIIGIFGFALWISGQAYAQTPRSFEKAVEFLDRCRRNLTSVDSVFEDFPELKITDAILKSQTDLQQDRLKETLFIVPSNDGEALRAVQILKALKAPHLHVVRGGWGAKLGDLKELPEIIWKHAGIKRIAILEIPGPREEDRLRKFGLQVVVFDHHHYGKELDRSGPVSSLEQLMEWIGWKASRQDLLIAINDRSYIPGLVDFGASPEMIRYIRTFDLVAQGRSKEEVAKKVAEIQADVIPRVPSEGGVYIVADDLQQEGLDTGILKQELALLQLDGRANILFLSRNQIGFTGSPAATRKLNELDFTRFGYAKKTRSGSDAYRVWGGGDETGSLFFNFRPKLPPRGKGEGKSGSPVEPGAAEFEPESGPDEPPSFATEMRILLGSAANRVLPLRRSGEPLIPEEVLMKVKEVVLTTVAEEQRKTGP